MKANKQTRVRLISYWWAHQDYLNQGEFLKLYTYPSLFQRFKNYCEYIWDDHYIAECCMLDESVFEWTDWSPTHTWDRSDED